MRVVAGSPRLVTHYASNSSGVASGDATHAQLIASHCVGIPTRWHNIPATLELRPPCDETKAKRKEARSIRESRLDPHMQPHFATDAMRDSRRTVFIPSDRLPTIGTRRQTQFAKRPQESRRWRQTRSGPVGHEGLGSICPRWHYFFAALLGSLTASRVAISVL